MVFQIVSMVGAALILVAYAGNQQGRIGPDRPLYNVLNLGGALLLLWVAVVDRRVGFILLESVWAAVTLPPLWRSFSGPSRAESGRESSESPRPLDS